MIHIKEKGTSIGKEMGTGLGLSYANEVTCSLGGELLIESKFEKGTEVKIILPKISKLADKN
jgi:signal transduction histidine kinase